MALLSVQGGKPRAWLALGSGGAGVVVTGTPFPIPVRDTESGFWTPETPSEGSDGAGTGFQLCLPPGAAAEGGGYVCWLARIPAALTGSCAQEEPSGSQAWQHATGCFSSWK